MGVLDPGPTRRLPQDLRMFWLSGTGHLGGRKTSRSHPCSAEDTWKAEMDTQGSTTTNKPELGLRRHGRPQLSPGPPAPSPWGSRWEGSRLTADRCVLREQGRQGRGAASGRERQLSLLLAS